MIDYPVVVIVWVCVAVFAATALITFAGLLRIVALPDRFLRPLFFTLVVETAAISVAAFGAYLKSSNRIVEAAQLNIERTQQSSARLESRVKVLEDKANVVPSRPSQKWETVRIDDCSGKDLPNPTQGAAPEPARCTAPEITAVCWDGAIFRNGASAWCTYKAVNPAQCSGGSRPGQLYRCNP
jgi:hypothetical protein